MKMRKNVILTVYLACFYCSMIALFPFSNHSVLAQETLVLQPSVQPGDKDSDWLKEKTDESPPSMKLSPPATQDGDELIELPEVKVFVKDIMVAGNTVFSDKELSEITSHYENRLLASEELEALRRDLTMLYLKNGYITSGAYIPDQNVGDGVIEIRIVEGRLNEINVENNKYLRDNYYRKRIRLGGHSPVRIENLQKQLRILQEDPLVDRIEAELKPGVEPGESNFNLTVEENLPFRLWFGFDNYIADSVGGDQITGNGMVLSLTGNRDVFSLTIGAAEGMQSRIDTWYSFPITARDLTLKMGFRNNDFDLVREEFKDLDVKTETEIYSVSLSYPLYTSLRHKFTFSLNGEHGIQETTLLGFPFSLEPGAVNGEVKVSAIRFGQDYVYRTYNQVFAALSLFSWGIDALDATVRNDDLPDGEFFKWQGQMQWARLFKTLDSQVVFRSFFQLTDEPLVALEQAAVGGRYTVRGYPENFFVRDKAVALSLEYRIPVVIQKSWADYLQIVPFFDWGWGENEDFPTPPGPNSIYSVGVGLRWATTLFRSSSRITPSFEIFYGHRLRDVSVDVENDLQDNGVSFQIAVGAF